MFCAVVKNHTLCLTRRSIKLSEIQLHDNTLLYKIGEISPSLHLAS
jgi:hypothetical protein